MAHGKLFRRFASSTLTSLRYWTVSFLKHVTTSLKSNESCADFTEQALLTVRLAKPQLKMAACTFGPCPYGRLLHSLKQTASSACDYLLHPLLVGRPSSGVKNLKDHSTNVRPPMGFIPQTVFAAPR